MMTETPLVRASSHVFLQVAVDSYSLITFNKLLNVGTCLPEFCKHL